MTQIVDFQTYTELRTKDGQDARAAQGLPRVASMQSPLGRYVLVPYALYHKGIAALTYKKIPWAEDEFTPTDLLQKVLDRGHEIEKIGAMWKKIGCPLGIAEALYCDGDFDEFTAVCLASPELRAQLEVEPEQPHRKWRLAVEHIHAAHARQHANASLHDIRAARRRAAESGGT